MRLHIVLKVFNVVLNSYSNFRINLKISVIQLSNPPFRGTHMGGMTFGDKI